MRSLANGASTPWNSELDHMARDVVTLWNEGDCRCEIQTGGIPGQGRFLIYCGDSIVTAESVPMGLAVYTCAEILRLPGNFSIDWGTRLP